MKIQRKALVWGLLLQIVVVILAAFVSSRAVAAPADATESVRDEDVGGAIDRLTAYLYSQQQKDGSWENEFAQSEQAGGETAIVVLALLHAGQSPQQPALAKAIEWLKPRPNDRRFRGTYAVSARLHVWAHLADAYEPLLKRDAAWLMEQGADDHSRFWYTAHPAGWDNSATHFGLLGVWEAAKRGVAVPRVFWEHAAAHFLKTQNPDGGWPYRDGQSYGSMTAAGLATLYIAHQQLYRKEKRSDDDIMGAIGKGLKWLDTRYSGPNNPGLGGKREYYLYAVERVGLAGGVKALHDQDWFRSGARYYGAVQRDDGSVARTVYDNAFALLFLARGRVPVWIAKLRINGQAWNNHPHDLDGLTRWLAHQREAKLNWQVVDVDAPAHTWLDSPMVFLSSHEAVHLDDARKARLKRYLELGGLLLCNPDDDSKVFSDSIAALARELFPGDAWRALDADDEVYRVLYQLGDIDAVRPIMGLSNGVRPMVLLFPHDWGYAFAAQDGEDDARFELMLNLWALSSDRGVLRNRLETPIESREDRPKVGELVVGRVSRAGGAPVEPAALEMLSNRVWDRAGLELKIIDVAPGRLAGVDAPPIAIWSGVGEVKLTPAQALDIREYVRGGGTLVVETIGGQGAFARSVEDELSVFFAGPPTPLAPSGPVLSGRGLEGGYDVRQVKYRRLTVAGGEVGHSPRLVAHFLEGRPAIILSHEDLSLGLLGMHKWNVNGYDVESSRRIMTNIMLWARRRTGDRPDDDRR